MELDAKIRADLGSMLTQGPIIEVKKLMKTHFQNFSSSFVAFSIVLMYSGWLVESMPFSAKVLKKKVVQKMAPYKIKQVIRMPMQNIPLKLANRTVKASNLGVTIANINGATIK